MSKTLDYINRLKKIHQSESSQFKVERDLTHQIMGQIAHISPEKPKPFFSPLEFKVAFVALALILLSIWGLNSNINSLTFFDTYQIYAMHLF